VFATSHGTVRRNKLSDFTSVRANGKIAMKLETGESLVGVLMCRPDQDVLLTTKKGKCIRFQASDVREFASRTSTGVRGIKLAGQDEVISFSVLEHVSFSIEERDTYLRLSRQRRGQTDEDFTPETAMEITLSEERYKELEDQEQFILTVSDRGFGKRTSAYEYRITNRGGQGITNMNLTNKNGSVVASFIADSKDEVVLVTNGGQLIRFTLSDVRIAGRSTQGVTLFRVASDEAVVSVAHVPYEEEEEGESAEAPEPDNQGALFN
jgi:DNA gyrase subunit A